MILKMPDVRTYWKLIVYTFSLMETFFLNLYIYQTLTYICDINSTDCNGNMIFMTHEGIFRND